MALERVKKRSISEKPDPDIELTIKETDFLLKLMVRSNFSGEELVQGYQTYEKLYHIHREMMSDE
tara:strand:+ start:1002 stop:1196 length:195 start_codon:yes stop_codon:yes gene_type:complete